MRRPAAPALALGAAAVLFAAGFWLLRTSGGAETERAREAALARFERDGPEAIRPALLVDALRVEPDATRIEVQVDGLLKAAREVVIGAEVSGRVVEITAREHSPVSQGDVLVRLDPALLEAAVTRDRASVKRAEATYQLARAELLRQTDLSKRGATSKADFERADAEASRAAAEVAEARARLVDSQTRLEKTRITAPFDGVVTRLDLEPGAFVRTGDEVAELQDLAEIEIEVGVDERQVVALRAGDPARLTVDVYGSDWFEGTIHGVSRAPDRRTLKYPIPVRVPNPDGRLLPGMIGHVRFAVGGGEPALRVPRSAVEREFELDYLYVLERDDDADTDEEVAVARRRRVATRAVAFRRDWIEVQSGLGPGERVAISGLSGLRDGTRVRVRDAEPLQLGVSSLPGRDAELPQ